MAGLYQEKINKAFKDIETSSRCLEDHDNVKHRSKSCSPNETMLHLCEDTREENNLVTNIFRTSAHHHHQHQHCYRPRLDHHQRRLSPHHHCRLTHHQYHHKTTHHQYHHKTIHQQYTRPITTNSRHKLTSFNGGGLILSISLPLFMIFVKMAGAHPVKCNVVTMFRLKTADCIGRKLNSVPTDLDPDLKVFKLSSNNLISLEFVDFHKYVHLHEISLTQNRLEFIYPLTFAPLKLLQVLDLERNSLYEIKEHFFANVSSLRVLILKSNPLHKMADDSFKNLFNLELLSLENCYLTSFKPEFMRDLKKLQELDLANNRLVSLDEAMYGNLPKSLTVVRLSGNAWQCDCKFRWFRRWLSDSSVNWNFPKNAPTCSTPDILRGVEWSQLKHDQFTCPARILANFSSHTVLEILIFDNLTIDCVVFGDPMPSVSWHKSSYDFSSLSRNTTKTNKYLPPSTYVSSLKIFSATSSDEGDYKCIAENAAGRSEVTFKVIVAVRDKESKGNSGIFPTASGEILLGVGVGMSVLIVIILLTVFLLLFRSKTSRGRLFTSTSLNGSACKRGKTSVMSAECSKKLQSLEREAADDKLLKENYYIFAPSLESSIYRHSSLSHEPGTFRISEPYVFPEIVSNFETISREDIKDRILTSKTSTLFANTTRSSHPATSTTMTIVATPQILSSTKTTTTIRRQFGTLDESGRKMYQKVNFALDNQRKLPNGSGLSRSTLDCSDKKMPTWSQSSELEIGKSKFELLKLHNIPKSALKKREVAPASTSIITSTSAFSSTSAGGQSRNECPISEHQSTLSRRLSFELAMEELHKDEQHSKSHKF